MVSGTVQVSETIHTPYKVCLAIYRTVSFPESQLLCKTTQECQAYLVDLYTSECPLLLMLLR